MPRFYFLSGLVYLVLALGIEGWMGQRPKLPERELQEGWIIDPRSPSPEMVTYDKLVKKVEPLRLFLTQSTLFSFGLAAVFGVLKLVWRVFRKIWRGRSSAEPTAA